MLGIENTGVYIPENRLSNYEKKAQFEIDDAFIEGKIGVRYTSVKHPEEKVADLCLSAFRDLKAKSSLDPQTIECLAVVTQNPDTNIPHVSAIVHGELELPEQCACFDISLGCSGYVYGLSVLQCFMQGNGFKKGLLFTADPYSKIVDPGDKNTSLLFGDAASVTLISEQPAYVTQGFNFGTIGQEHRELTCRDNVLYLNGRAIFNFAARYVPRDIRQLLEKHRLQIGDIDCFVFHQGSKYIVDTITKTLGLDPAKVAYDMADYGNTVSSSIPIILNKEIPRRDHRHIVISGFGAGLSWASTILTRPS